jgi:hypothetical protein
MKTVILFALSFFIIVTTTIPGENMKPQVIQQAIEKLTISHGGQSRNRIEKGVRQVADLWTTSDGTEQEFIDFCQKHFISDPSVLEQTFLRFDSNLETISGHAVEVSRDLSRALQVEVGAILPVDYLFAEYDPNAHVMDDFFKTRIAFVALLNFPLSSLDERLAQGQSWSRMQWAQTRLASRFSHRVPAPVNQELTSSYVQADDYISNYNIYMHQLLDAKGNKPFPAGLKLISHWGLRDELKAQYAQANGFSQQQLIQTVMERIIRQEIPIEIINSDQYDWDPQVNVLYHENKKIDFNPESGRRYQHWLSIFKAEQQADIYYPDAPRKIDRSFKLYREIQEQEFEKLISSLLTDPIAPKVATLISKRLKRKLQPFDIWYNGFKVRSGYDETALDKMVMEKYPAVDAFQQDLPRILQGLGFSAEKAQFLAHKITVDPSRGVGHALGAGRRQDNAHLRTRIPPDGMRYKGYNIAIHELGHNVEQVFSLNSVDYIALQGVPNTAFTEAFAFVFQSRDQELLGLSQTIPMADHLMALDNYWAACEIGAVGLVDLQVWHWLYDHPQASAQELRDQVVTISQAIWNQYYAPLTGIKDAIILGIYSHMIDAGLYLPDYSIGQIIMFQIEQYLQEKNLGDEMERMCRLGSITPDAWMQSAIHSAISTEPMLAAVREAVKVVK